MSVPRSYNLGTPRFAPRLKFGGARALWFGDSISNPNTSANADTVQSSAFQGWIRNWPWAWGGIMVPGSGGGGLAIRTGGTGVGTTVRNPDATFDSVQTRFNTHPRPDNSFGTTVADGTNIFGSYVIPGFTVQSSLSGIFLDQTTRATAAMLRHPDGAASVRLDLRRVDSAGSGAVSKSTTSGVTLNGTRAVISITGSIATHAGGTRPYPDCFVEMDGASNTDAQSAQCLGIWFDRTDLTSALKFFGGGVGGSTSADWLDVNDDDASATTFIDDEAMMGYCAATLIDTVFIHIGANDSGGGDNMTSANYKRRVARIAQRWYSAMVAAGTPDPAIVFVTQYGCINAPLENVTVAAESQYDICRAGIDASTAPSGSPLTYIAVPRNALGLLNLPALLARAGPVTGEINADGTFVSGPGGATPSTGTYMVDSIHWSRLGVDHTMNLVFDEFEAPYAGGPRSRERSRPMVTVR